MNYRVEFHAAALAQLDGLPSQAFDTLVDERRELIRIFDVTWVG